MMDENGNTIAGLLFALVATQAPPPPDGYLENLPPFSEPPLPNWTELKVPKGWDTVRLESVRRAFVNHGDFGSSEWSRFMETDPDLTRFVADHFRGLAQYAERLAIWRRKQKAKRLMRWRVEWAGSLLETAAEELQVGRELPL
jgi:hypothetical protein